MIKIYKAEELESAGILTRTEDKFDVRGAVSAIIADVRQNGDEALRRLTYEYDKTELDSIELSADAIDSLCVKVDETLMRSIRLAAENIRAFHEKQKRASFVLNEKPGVVTGQKILPIARVGVYIPGGTAPLFSTVLMNVIPAKLAGVPEIFVFTPPSPSGIHPAIAAAAKIAGADRIFTIGGAQAVAAAAYGTQSVPRVDKIVGPGNAFVAEAKRQVFGTVAIDMIAGPSEILIVADGKSDPVCVAADLLSQAEHDKNASAVLITDSPALAEAVAPELEHQLALLPRQEIARASIETNGKIILSEDIPSAIDLANRLAPEHLELCLDDPFDYLERVKNAGSVFLGRSAPEALGDYMAGPNHTLPTSGTARFSSPLSVDDFIKKMQFIYYSPAALSGVSGDIANLARAEGLEGHARSALARGKGENV